MASANREYAAAQFARRRQVTTLAPDEELGPDTPQASAPVIDVPDEDGPPAAIGGPPGRGNGGFRFRKRHIGAVLLLVLAGLGAPYVLHQVAYNRRHPSTDDAAVDGDLYPVSPRIAGRVAKVRVENNDYVKAGQVLVELDTADLEVQLAQAEAAAATEEAAIRGAQAGVGVTQRTTASATGQAAAAVAAAQAQAVAARYQTQVGATQVDAARAGEEAALTSVADSQNGIRNAEAGVAAAKAALSSAEAGVSAAAQAVAAAQAAVRSAEDGVGVAEADEASAEATAKRCASDLQRARRLVSEGAMSQAQLDAAEAAVGTSEAAVAAAGKRVSAARSTLDQAKANLSAATSNLRQAEARRDQARAGVEQSEAVRQSALQNAKAAVARARQAHAAVEQASKHMGELVAAVDQRRAGVAQAQAALRGTSAAPLQVQQSAAQAGGAQARLKEARAKIDQILLQLSYARIVAQHDGIVSQRNVNEGQSVQPGQLLMAIVDLGTVYVTANYKETQVRAMRVGDRATFTVDAYPGMTFRGHVASLSPGTGSVFALIPPQNATGNFTKVVQRLPVRITVDTPPDANHPLRLGMSVIATVATQ